MGLAKNIKNRNKVRKQENANMKAHIEDHNRLADAANWEFQHGKHEYYGGGASIYRVPKGKARDEAHAKKIGQRFAMKTTPTGALVLPAYSKKNPHLFTGAKTYAANEPTYKRKVKGKTITVRKGKRR